MITEGRLEVIQKNSEGFNGYLHVDGYAGYNKVEQAKLAGCWAMSAGNMMNH
jgi:hypothetical protein